MWSITNHCSCSKLTMHLWWILIQDTACLIDTGDYYVMIIVSNAHWLHMILMCYMFTWMSRIWVRALPFQRHFALRMIAVSKVHCCTPTKVVDWSWIGWYWRWWVGWIWRISAVECRLRQLPWKLLWLAACWTHGSRSILPVLSHLILLKKFSMILSPNKPRLLLAAASCHFSESVDAQGLIRHFFNVKPRCHVQLLRMRLSNQIAIILHFRVWPMNARL